VSDVLVGTEGICFFSWFLGRGLLSTVIHFSVSIDYHSHVDMKTAQGYIVPWLCSQTDLLAIDWELVED
jgi:hypothetical protein